MVFGTAALVLAAGFAFADPDASPQAQVHSVGLDEVHWTRGFWADRFEVCCQQMVPGMWALMSGTNYSHYFQNFRIAAGLAEGRHRGAQFNDGDFYKWLEGACAVLAVTKDPKLERVIEEVVSVIAAAQPPDGYVHTTREPRYLELAGKFLAIRDLVTDGGDDNQDRITFRQQTNAMGHAVRANYLYAGAAGLFAETGDGALWTPLERI